ncbi:hypothetical protein [Rossellomorea vietnamensis]|uniref:Uncharacterized protein n=1 Tax=Rossellomorea vietnamensis TaxID=218284 RepID=A0A0P6VUT9_9BACI|nr:hypothetical protein [Rossellomorea vietnamensis]KPL58422.1 hypothetical protein AM506_16305 [Rossellomorea vietnamensis]
MTRREIVMLEHCFKEVPRLFRDSTTYRRSISTRQLITPEARGRFSCFFFYELEAGEPSLCFYVLISLLTVPMQYRFLIALKAEEEKNRLNIFLGQFLCFDSV